MTTHYTARLYRDEIDYEQMRSLLCDTYPLTTPPLNCTLGDLGAVIGWPLFLSAVVIGSTITGMLAGEWKQAGSGPMRIMGLGVACLVV